jgi:DNA-binding response OmpR family regulator
VPNQKLSVAINEARKSFIASLPEVIEKHELVFTSYNKKIKKEVKLDEISTIFRELHNIKSVAGSYGESFIQSATRNIIDHVRYLYDLDVEEIIDLNTALEVYKLLKKFLKETKDKTSTVHLEELNELVKGSGNTLRALVVETDRMILKHLKKELESCSIAYTVVDSGAEAFATLLNEKFDILITDYHTGKLEGPSLIAANRVSNSINKDIKTILISLSYFDLLPSVSVPDFFVSKNEDIIKDFKSALSSIVKNNQIQEDKESVNILCLDDDDNIHDLLKIAFSSENFEYNAAKTGEEFVKQYRNKKPDIILLDLILEKENGVDVINKAKKSGLNFDVPVIVLSSLDRKLKSEIVSDVPFIIGTLSKPFTPKSIASSVMELFKQSKKTFNY